MFTASSKDSFSAEPHLQSVAKYSDEPNGSARVRRALSKCHDNIAWSFVRADGNLKEALSWAQRAAADHQNRESFFQIGKAVLCGKFSFSVDESDREKALELLKEEGLAGDLESCLLLAEFYASSPGDDHDHDHDHDHKEEERTSCRFWAEKAQEQFGVGFAAIATEEKERIDTARIQSLSRYLSNGEYVPSPGELVPPMVIHLKARKLLESFQKTQDLDELKEAAALFEQVVSLSIGEMEKDVRGEACLFLYRIHDGDINPDFADAGQAWRYLKMGAEAEHPSLQSFLARRYHHGEGHPDEQRRSREVVQSVPKRFGKSIVKSGTMHAEGEILLGISTRQPKLSRWRNLTHGHQKPQKWRERTSRAYACKLSRLTATETVTSTRIFRQRKC